MSDYSPFDKYIVQGEPDKLHKALNWQIAIGLQAVDNLKTSDYLAETAQRHIEGEIPIDEVKRRVDAYYETSEGRKLSADRTDEADKVASNIADLLAENAFSFTPAQLALIHRRLFSGILKHAGEYRDVNLSKSEWVLDGDTVYYTPFPLVADTLDYEFRMERGYTTKGASHSDIVRHIASFTSNIWQIHPFREGNTRSTAVFIIKYLRKLGFSMVGNDAFKLHSWYFRNALVRANYNNQEHDIVATTLFLERFFDNLLFNTKHILKNRYCHVFWDGPINYDEPNETVNGTANDTLNDTVKPTLSKLDKAVLKHIAKNNSITYDELAASLHKSRSTIYRTIKSLMSRGMLIRHGSDKSGSWIIPG